MTSTTTVSAPRLPTDRQLPVIVGIGLATAESRPVVQAVVMLRFATAAVATCGVRSLSEPTVWVAAAAWLLANSSVYLFNGLLDITEDRENGKCRPLARGDLHPHRAWAILTLTLSASITLAALVSQIMLLLVGVLIVAGLFYSWTPAKMLRNPVAPLLFISVGGLGTYSAGAIAAGGIIGVPVLVLGMVMTGWMGLVGGIVKDFTDVAGDRKAGRRTLTVLVGAVRASAVGGGAALCLGVAFVVTDLATHTLILLAPALTLLACGLAVLIACMRVESSPASPYRLFMCAQYAVHLTALAVFVPYWVPLA